MAAKDLALLTKFLNTPGLTSLILRNVTSGELILSAVDPSTGQPTAVYFDPSETKNVLQDAPRTWWSASTDLFSAVVNDWISVIDPNAQVSFPVVTQIPVASYIVTPVSPTVGDLLVWNGTSWVSLEAGTSGYVLTSTGPGQVPTYQIVGAGSPGALVTATGLTTTGLANGDVGYISGNNTWLLARSDATQLQASAAGVNLGTPGVMVLNGVIGAAKFTTDGGTPSPGQEVYLAAGADDGGSGAGKLTATPPSSGWFVVVGKCLDNSNYAGLKTAVVIFDPQSPIEL